MQKDRAEQTNEIQETDTFLNTMGAANDDGAAPDEENASAESAVQPQTDATATPENNAEAAAKSVRVIQVKKPLAPQIRPARETVSLKLFWAVAIVCGIGIALCAGRNISDFKASVLMPDELGYWGNAAIFAGRDWHDIMTLIPLYGYGYSLLLVPLFWLGLPMSVMYQVAIYMNIAMLLLAFALSYLCLRRLFTALQPIPTLLIAAATTLYTNTIAQAEVAWDETLLYLLYWLMFWLLLRLLEKPTYKWTVLLALCGGYMYMVHMRTLGILVALALTGLLLWAAHRLDGKHTLAFFGSFAAIVFLQNAIKLWTNANIYTGAGMAGKNDYGVMADKLSEIFTQTNILSELFISACGKIYYIGAATMLLAFVSLYLLFSDFFTAMWSWFRTGFKRFDAHKIPSAFLLLSFGATVVINIVTMQNAGRLDTLIYGRYMEFAFGPLIAIGIALLVLGRVSIGQVLGYTGAFIGLSIVTNTEYNSLLRDGITTLNSVCVITLDAILKLLDKGPNSIFLVALASLSAFWLMWGVQYACGRYLVLAYGSPRKIRVYRVIRPLLRTFLPMVLAAGVWIWADISFTTIEEAQGATVKNRAQMDMLLETAQANPSAVYWVCNDNNEQLNVSRFQTDYGFALHMISRAEFDTAQLDANALYVTTAGSSTNLTVAERGIKIIDSGWWNIYAVPGSMWETAAANMPLSLSGTGEFALYYGGAAEDMEVPGREDTEPGRVVMTELQQRSDGKYQTCIPIGIGTNGQQGVVVNGSTVNLPAGKYEMSFTITLQDAGGKTDLGRILLLGKNGKHLKSIKLKDTDFTPGEPTTVVLRQSTTLDEFLGETYFQLIAEQGVRMTLNEVVYARTEMASEVISADTTEMDTMSRLLELDYEHHAIYALPRESQMMRASVKDLQSAFPQWEVKLASNLNDVRDNPGILLVPTDRNSMIYELLAEYSILEKIGSYTVMVPNDSSIYSEFVGHGGMPMSNGYEVQLRYYTESSSAEAGTIAATPPAGKYRLLMCPEFSNTMKSYYGSVQVKVDGENVMGSELEKNDERNASFYMPLVLTVDGGQEISVEINSDANALISNLNVSLRLLGDGAATYGDTNE